METNLPDKITVDEGKILCEHARRSIEKSLGLSKSETEDARLNQELAKPVFAQERGVFVTLHKAGQLRGCIGSLIGYESIRDGIARNAKSAAFQDSRFSPVRAEELAGIKIEISVLTDPADLSYNGPEDLLASLRPGVDGVIIKKGPYGATFLPQVWEQLPDGHDFLSRLSLKAGLPMDGWQDPDLVVKVYQVQHFEEG